MPGSELTWGLGVDVMSGVLLLVSLSLGGAVVGGGGAGTGDVAVVVVAVVLGDVELGDFCNHTPNSQLTNQNVSSFSYLFIYHHYEVFKMSLSMILQCNTKSMSSGTKQ